MKFFLSFLQSPHNHPVPAYQFWERYIKNGIQEAGYEWEECPGADWALGLVPKSNEDQLKWKQSIWRETIDHLKKNPADVFLSYLYPNQVDESAILEIRKMGIPCVNFFCDNVREFTKAPREYAVFDLNWVPEHKALKLYAKAGYPYVHLPMPVWVSPESRIVKPEKYEQITFLGSKDIQRQILIEEIIKLSPELPLAVYGSGWVEMPQSSATRADYTLTKSLLYQLSFLKEKGPNAYLNKIKNRKFTAKPSAALLEKYKGGHQLAEYAVLTAESMITVGVNRYPSFHFPLLEPDTYSRLRDIEAPMLGACYLTEWTEGIEEMYVVGEEIEIYRDAEDFVVKAKELQYDPQKRNRLKVNGQKRALKDHNISNSLNKIINKLKL